MFRSGEVPGAQVTSATGAGPSLIIVGRVMTAVDLRSAGAGSGRSVGKVAVPRRAASRGLGRFIIRRKLIRNQSGAQSLVDYRYSVNI